jgi:hypothetical protein
VVKRAARILAAILRDVQISTQVPLVLLVVQVARLVDKRWNCQLSTT